MGSQGTVLLRGMRWRLTGSILIVVMAAIAIGTAILGPLYLQAGGDSLVKRAVNQAGVSQTGFTLAPGPGRSGGVSALDAERNRLLAAPDLRGLSAAAYASVQSGAYMTAPDGTPYESEIVARTGVCAALHFSSGRCDLGRGDAVLSVRSARALGVVLGGTIRLHTPDDKAAVTVRVSGLYTLPDVNAAYWFGAGASFFLFDTIPPTHAPPFVDDFFVSPRTAASLPAAFAPAASLQIPLRHDSVGGANAQRTRRAVTAAEARANAGGYSFSTELPAVLSGALHQRRLMDTIVTVAALQLVLLAIWVLASALLRSADLRRSELRVARLRGFPFLSVLGVTVSEPAMLCAAGAVLGVIGAWAAVEIASHVLFTAGTTVSLDSWVFIGFAAVALSICAVLGLSALRLLRGSGLERAAEPGRAGGRSRTVGDVAILVLSGVALIAAATSGALASHSDPVAAAAPAVVALGVSVIAVRVVEFLCRRASSATTDSSAVAWFLAVRQIGRRPAALRESRTLVIAICLACFAVCAWSVARSNRFSAATFALGAPTVVTVTPHGVNLQSAVDHVDPHGRFAMAAVNISTSDSNLLGVDAGRLAAVMAWPGGVSRASLAQVSRALAPRTAPQVDLSGASLSLTARVSGTGAVARHLAAMDLSVWVFSDAGGTSIIDLGPVSAGSRDYRGSLTDSCPGGCRLEGVGLLPDSSQVPVTGQIELGVSALDGNANAHPNSPGAGDLTAADWRSTTANVAVGPAARGVSFAIPAAAVVADEGAVGTDTPPMASVADYPSPLPAAAGAGAVYIAAESAQENTLTEDGLDGAPVTIRPVISAVALPRTGTGGVMVDLTLLQRAQTQTSLTTVTDEVWLGSHAPADAVRRLRAAGLRVDRVQRAARVIAQGRHTGPALAYDFMLLATLVALLTAAVSTFGVLAAGIRQRATELTALEVSGIPRATLIRALALEAAILSTTALFGAAAGVLGAALAIPSLPQLGAATTAPLSYALPVLLVLAVALAAVLVVIAATALAGRGILTAMSPSLLRAAADDAG